MTDFNAPRTPPKLTSLSAWQALTAHHEQHRGQHLHELFASDPGRGERLSAEAAGWYLDYSKQRITDDTLRLLLQLPCNPGEFGPLQNGVEFCLTLGQRTIIHVVSVMHMLDCPAVV